MILDFIFVKETQQPKLYHMVDLHKIIFARLRFVENGLRGHQQM